MEHRVPTPVRQHRVHRGSIREIRFHQPRAGAASLHGGPCADCPAPPRRRRAGARRPPVAADIAGAAGDQKTSWHASTTPASSPYARDDTHPHRHSPNAYGASIDPRERAADHMRVRFLQQLHVCRTTGRGVEHQRTHSKVASAMPARMRASAIACTGGEFEQIRSYSPPQLGQHAGHRVGQEAVRQIGADAPGLHDVHAGDRRRCRSPRCGGELAAQAVGQPDWRGSLSSAGRRSAGAGRIP